MKNSIFTLILWTIIIGGIIGLFVVIFIKLFFPPANTVLNLEELIGHVATVTVPFDSQTRGKVTLNFQGSVLDFVAYTESKSILKTGDKVIVIAHQTDGLWVTKQDF